MTLPGREYERRRSRLRDRMAERGLEALLVWCASRGDAGVFAARNDVGYVVDWPIRQPGSGPALLVFPLEGPPAAFVSGPLYALDHAEAASDVADTRHVTPGRFADEARDVIRDRTDGGGRIGVVRLEEVPL